MNTNLIIFGALGLGAYLVFGNKASAQVMGPSPGDATDLPPSTPSASATVLMTDPTTGMVLLSDGRQLTRAQYIQMQRRTF